MVFLDVSVSVKEGDLVILYTNAQTIKQEMIRWFFNDIRFAVITGDQRKICTDNEGIERFRDRLKLDHQTGSLTIMNTTNTDEGEYHLQIINNYNSYNETRSDMIYRVSVDEQDEMTRKSVKKGESVTLYPGIIRNPNDVMKWYFNDILIAENQSKICTDVRCKRFRDRLKLDHQTGSLNIMNTRNTDEGEYKLLISSSSRFIIIRSFSVSVIAVPDSGLCSDVKRFWKKNKETIIEVGVGFVGVVGVTAGAVVAALINRNLPPADQSKPDADKTKGHS